jgi:hypothetical protein
VTVRSRETETRYNEEKVMKITFKFIRDTKNTRLFEETHHDGKAIKPEDAIIRSLYVKKDFANNREELIVSIPGPEKA